MRDNSRTLCRPILDVQIPALIVSPYMNIYVCAGIHMEVERESKRGEMTVSLKRVRIGIIFSSLSTCL